MRKMRRLRSLLNNSSILDDGRLSKRLRIPWSNANFSAGNVLRALFGSLSGALSIQAELTGGLSQLIFEDKYHIFQLWLSGNIRQPEMKVKKNNFGKKKVNHHDLILFLALRGTILEAKRNPTDADQFSVMMTIQEDYNQHWVSGFSARLNVTLRKRKHFPLGTISSHLRALEKTL